MHDEVGVKLVAFLTAVQRDFWFVIPDFPHECGGFATADVGRITHDEVKGRRHTAQKISFQEMHMVCNVVTHGVATGDGERGT